MKVTIKVAGDLQGAMGKAVDELRTAMKIDDDVQWQEALGAIGAYARRLYSGTSAFAESSELLTWKPIAFTLKIMSLIPWLKKGVQKDLKATAEMSMIEALVRALLSAIGERRNAPQVERVKAGEAVLV